MGYPSERGASYWPFPSEDSNYEVYRLKGTLQQQKTEYSSEYSNLLTPIHDFPRLAGLGKPQAGFTGCRRDLLAD